MTRYNYDDWRQRAKSFTGIAAFRPTNMTLAGAGDPERIPIKMITATLLPLLGVMPLHGRGFGEADDRPGAESVAILSAAFADRRFSGIEPVGRTLQLDNRVYTIVGVLPPGFELFQPADVYVPFGPWAATLPEDRGWHPGIFPVARLKARRFAGAGAGRDGHDRAAARRAVSRVEQERARARHPRAGSGRPERQTGAAHADRRRRAWCC